MLRADCRQVQKSFLALEEGRLDAAGAAKVRGHLSVCPECRAAWEGWQADARLLRDALAPARAPRNAVEAAMAAIRLPAPKRSGVRRLAVGWQVAAVAAAAILVVGAVMILTGGRTRRVGEVVSLTGQPLAQQRGAHYASALGLGAGIYEGCRLMTGAQDEAELSFKDGSRLVVKQGAEVKLDSLGEGQGGTGHGLPHICLSRGEVLCDLKSPQYFRCVGTPLGCVFTGGGRFRVRYVPETMLVVQLLDGAGVLSYGAGETRLNPGDIWVLEPGTSKPWQAPGTIWGR